MLLLSLVLLIALGILLLVLEILILPGLIAGIIGAIFIMSGIGLIYSNYGNTYGHIALFSTVLISIGLLIYFLKTKAWNRFSLKQTIDSKIMDLNAEDNIHEGDIGITVSALRPMGTIMIGDNKFEAQSQGELIETNTTVEVIKVLGTKLLVKISK